MSMRRVTLLLCLVLLMGSLGKAQLKVIKPVVAHAKYTRLAFGYGRSRSVVYLNRNLKDNNDARGNHFSVVYGGSRLMRISAEFTHFNLKDIAPTWYNVKANTFEANVHFLAHFKSGKAYFYPIAGLSYNVFKGYFTGLYDYLNLKSIYPINQVAVTRWFGLNVGTGFEYFFKPGSFFIDYKMRLGKSQGTEHFNIMDVTFCAGLRYNLKAPSVYQIFRGTRSRYFINSDGKNADW
jgi:hypothetical protein